VQHADEQLGLLPAPVEAEEELVQRALEVLRADAVEGPAQPGLGSKTVCAQGTRCGGRSLSDESKESMRVSSSRSGSDRLAGCSGEIATRGDRRQAELRAQRSDAVRALSEST